MRSSSSSRSPGHGGSGSARLCESAISGPSGSSACRWPPTTSGSRSPSRGSMSPGPASPPACDAPPGQSVNTVEIWLRDPNGLDATLEQARSQSYGLRGLRLTTRSGIRLVLDQAAGIVIALLVALSVIALVTAGVMLAASSRAEVDRRLRGIGVRRALGAGRRWVAGAAALESFTVAAPAAGLGVLAGGLVATPPSTRLLELLNETPPGPTIVGPLVGCWALAVGVAVLGAAWPAWRAAGRPPAALLRGADLPAGGRRGERPAGRLRLNGLAGLGARLVAARRARLASTLVVLGVSASFILLMLALASELVALRSDPGVARPAVRPHDIAAGLVDPAGRRRRRSRGRRAALRGHGARLVLARRDDRRRRLPGRPHAVRSAAPRLRPPAGRPRRGRGRQRAGERARARCRARPWPSSFRGAASSASASRASSARSTTTVGSPTCPRRRSSRPTRPRPRRSPSS